jgi:hypothetical protein
LSGHGVSIGCSTATPGVQQQRQVALKQFIFKCCEQGAIDAEAIVVLALIHLKQLDEVDAHRVNRVRSRSGKNGTNDPASD